MLRFVDLLSVGLGVWGWSLSRRPGAPRWLRLVPWVMACVFVLSLVGVLLGLTWVFGSTPDVPADQRATVVSVGISRVMGLVAAGLAIDVVVTVALLVETVRARRR